MNCIGKVIMRLMISIFTFLLVLAPALPARERGHEAIEREVMEEMRALLGRRDELAAETRLAEAEERAVTEAKSADNVVGRFFLRRRLEILHERMTRISRIKTEIAAREKRIETLHDEGLEAIRRDGNDPERVRRLELLSGRAARRLEAALAGVEARLERQAASPRERAMNEAERTRLEAELAEARRAFNSAYGVKP